MKKKERLQKILARAGIASRRTAEEFIRQGRVSIDGVTATEMGIMADPEQQRITFDGKPITIEAEKIYILLNKPKGYVTTLQDPQGRPVVTSLLKDLPVRVFPVGRLDIDTEGALLLTNDGELAQKIQHPSHEVNKTYEACVAGHPAKEKLAWLEQGIMLEGRKTWPAQITIISQTRRNTTIRITIHEGKKRQVRKMFAAIDHRVLALRRTAYGNLSLGELAPGHFRFLNGNDLARIFARKNILCKNKSI